jgi:hypothetical protein
MKHIARFLALSLLSMLLGGCFYPIVGTTLNYNTVQNFSIYTPLPGQSVRVLCNRMQLTVPYPNVYIPQYSSTAFLPASSVEVTGSSPVNPGSSYPLYKANVPITFGTLFAGTPWSFGCWTPLAPGPGALLKPQIWDGVAWKDWYRLDQAGVNCLNDNSRHNDNPNDPNWYARGASCGSTASGAYPLRGT